MKKVIASIVSLSLITGLGISAGFYNYDRDTINVNAAGSSTPEYNGLLYSSNGTQITITGHTEDVSPKKLVIPDTIDGLPVTQIEGWVFNDLHNITSVKLGRFITEIGDNNFAETVEELTIPDCWDVDYTEAFLRDLVDDRCYHIKKIIVPETVEKIGKFFTENDPSKYLQEFEVSSSNKKYASVDGVLYTKDMKTLIRCPRDKQFTSFTVPASVKTISRMAFSGNNSTSISSFDMGRNVTTIGEGAVTEILHKANEIKIPTALETFDLKDEQNWITHEIDSEVPNLYIPSYVKSINDFFLDNDYSKALKTITVEAGNRYFKTDKGILYNENELIKCPQYNNITTYKVLYETTKIKTQAFKDVLALESLTIPSTVTEISPSAFSGTEMKIIKGYSGTYAEEFASDYDYEFVSLGEPVVSGKCTDDIEWVLNRETGEMNITGTGEMCDYNITNGEYQPWDEYIDDITNVVIGEGITSIGYGTFEDHYNLEKVVLPESLRSIGAAAFYKCTCLGDINIPDNIVHVNVDAFTNTSWFDNQPDGPVYVGKSLYKLKGIKSKLTIKEGTVEIAPYAFMDDAGNSNEKLRSVSMPDSVTKIGHYAFYKCTGLTDIKISNGLESIGSWAFYSCENLKEISIPESVNYIGETAFAGCISVSEITVPETVDEISSWAFAWCYALKRVTIPETIKKIAPDAFKSCRRTIVFLVEEDSVAADYCEEKGINYSYDNGETIVGYFPGREYDMESDGVINLKDLNTLIWQIIDNEMDDDALFHYDINVDGQIDVLDVIALREIFLSK